MCYSEKLNRDLGGHQTQYGWVLVGHKAILECEKHPGEFRALYQGSPGKRPDRYDPLNPWQYYYTGFGLTFEDPTAEKVHYHYQFRKAVEDEHGFHVGGSVRGGFKGLLKSIDARDRKGRHGEPVARFIRRHSMKYHIMRVLVPEWTIRDNHATVMMALPPGKYETEADIMDVAEFAWKADEKNRAAKRKLDESMAVQIPSLMPPTIDQIVKQRDSKVEKITAMYQTVSSLPSVNWVANYSNVYAPYRPKK